MICDFIVHGREVPLRFSVLIGEIVHHLRSSLDHLIWALVLQRHHTPDFKVQFPICLNDREFKMARKKGIIKGISSSAQAIIERLQPHQDANWRDTVLDSPLRIIHDLNITDKHTLLAVVVSAAHMPNTIHFSGQMADTKLARINPHHWADKLLRAEPSGTKVLTIHFVKMHPELKVKADFRYQVAFEDFGTREIEPVIPGLTLLRDATVKTINLFVGEF